MESIGRSARAKWWLGCTAAALVGAATVACSSTPPPEAPSDPVIDSEPVEKETWGPSPEEPEPEAPAAPPPDEPDAQLLPDEHDISIADCRLLAAQYAAVTRADQAAALKPGLTDAQRQQAIAAIDSVASKMEASWSEGCEESLVGKVMDPRSLKCAVRATTVAEFDGCLNDPAE